MIFLTGDTHGRVAGGFDRIEKLCITNGTTIDDVIVILGDAGINFNGGLIDCKKKLFLSELPITLLCIHGNHEMRPDTIATYKQVERFGGVCYVEDAYPNILFAKDGEVYELGGKSCIAIGGANSIDKHLRVAGVSWWPDEQPSVEIKERVEGVLYARGWSVDVVLTHTCPRNYMPCEAFMPGVEQHLVDNGTEIWLDGIEQRLNYSAWYCGHFHINKRDDKITFMFDDIRQL